MSIAIFFSYIFLGLSLAAPIGPINAAQLDKGIKNGFLHAWMVGIGAMVADIIYMMLVYLGVVHFIEIPIIKAFLWLFGFFVLVYTGVEGLLDAGQLDKKDTRGPESIFRSFSSGFLMSLSNPLTILFWLGIYGSILAKTVASFGSSQLLMYSVTIIIGVILWDVTMAGIASGFRRYLNTKMLMIISVISSLSLIGFGIYFGIQAFKLLFT